MSDIDKDLDGAARRLKDGTPDPNPARTRNPSYRVFVEIPSDGSDEGGTPGDWRLIGAGAVVAPSRKDAIKIVDPEGSGRYLVIPEKEFNPVTRKTRVETVDDWE